MQQDDRSKSMFNESQEQLSSMTSILAGASPFGLGAILEMQRKNMQAMAEINQRVAQGWQAIAHRQMEMVGQMLADQSGLAREAFKEGQPAERLDRQTDFFKVSYERSINHSKEIGEIARQCTLDTADLLTKRIAGTLSDIGKNERG